MFIIYLYPLLRPYPIFAIPALFHAPHHLPISLNQTICPTLCWNLTCHIQSLHVVYHLHHIICPTICQSFVHLSLYPPSSILIVLQYPLRRMNKTRQSGFLITTSMRICGQCLKKWMVTTSPLVLYFLPSSRCCTPLCLSASQYSSPSSISFIFISPSLLMKECSAWERDRLVQHRTQDSPCRPRNQWALPPLHTQPRACYHRGAAKGPGYPY